MKKTLTFISILLIIIFSSCKKELMKITYFPVNYQGVWKTYQKDTISFSVNDDVPVLNYYKAGLLGGNKVKVTAIIRNKEYNSSNNTYSYNLTIPYISVTYDYNSTIIKLDSVVIKGEFISLSKNEILANYSYTQGRKPAVRQQLYFTRL